MLHRIAVVLGEPRGVWLTKGPGDDPDDCSFTAPIVHVDEARYSVRDASVLPQLDAFAELFNDLPGELEPLKVATVETAAGGVSIFIARSPAKPGFTVLSGR